MTAPEVHTAADARGIWDRAASRWVFVPANPEAAQMWEDTFELTFRPRRTRRSRTGPRVHVSRPAGGRKP